MAGPTDTVTSDAKSDRRFGRLHLFIAVLAGLGIGTFFFGDRSPKTPVTREPVSAHQPQSPPSEPQPLAIVESQIIRVEPTALRRGGSHRVAVFNAGHARLQIRQGRLGDGLRLEVPTELAPDDVGFVTISWSPVGAARTKPWRRSADIRTNDPKSKVISFVLAEVWNDRAPPEPGRE